jgi:hypothetical protein
MSSEREDGLLRTLFTAAAEQEASEPSAGFAKKVMSTIGREPVSVPVLLLLAREQAFVQRFAGAAVACALLAMMLIYRGTLSSVSADELVSELTVQLEEPLIADYLEPDDLG